jgi:hypothetical protein
MAQTTTKSRGNARSASAARRSDGSQSRKSNGSSGTARTTRARPANTRTKRASSTASRPRSSSSEVEAQGTGFGDAVSKAKTPLIAGGAAVAGLVGGVAISRNRGNKGPAIPKLGGKRKGTARIPMPKMSRPRGTKGNSTGKALGATAKALGNTAVEIGKAGYRVGQLTSEVRMIREQAASKE